MSQTNVVESQEILEAPQAEPSEAERLARIVAQVKADAASHPEQFLQETIVPEGGE